MFVLGHYSPSHLSWYSPFLAPWKKNLTTKTCSTAIPTIMKTSTRLKLKILCSVLLTVLKFRFSLVLKYFCILLIVLSWPLTLKIESSSAECCSGLEPAFCGRRADLDSSSTCGESQHHFPPWILTLEGERTAISKSTILSANVDISLLKQNLYSPTFCAVKTKSPCRSFCPSMIFLSLGPITE